MCVCIHVGVRTVGSVCVCRWRKLNVVHFPFKLFEQRHRLWRWRQRWILMRYSTCGRGGGGGGRNNWTKSTIFKTVTGIVNQKCQSVSYRQKSRSTSPTEFKAHFYAQLAKYNFCWQKQTPRSTGDHLWETLFFTSRTKDECLTGAEKRRRRKENIRREKSAIQECKTVMHHSQIQ